MRDSAAACPLEDGAVRPSNNAAERAIRPIAAGRFNWTFAGSGAGGRRAVMMCTLIETAKVNCLDPSGWLADVLARLPDRPAQRIGESLPRAWSPPQPLMAAA